MHVPNLSSVTSTENSNSENIQPHFSYLGAICNTQISSPQPIWMPWWENLRLHLTGQSNFNLQYIDSVIKGIRQICVSQNFFQMSHNEQIQNELEVLTFVVAPKNLYNFFSEIFLVLNKSFEKNLLEDVFQVVGLCLSNAMSSARLNKEASKLKYTLIRTEDDKTFILNNKKDGEAKNIDKTLNSVIRHAIDPCEFNINLQNIVVKKVHPRQGEDIITAIKNEVQIHSLLSKSLTHVVPLLGAKKR